MITGATPGFLSSQVKEKVEPGPRALFSRNRKRTSTQKESARVIGELKFRYIFGDIQIVKGNSSVYERL